MTTRILSVPGGAALLRVSSPIAWASAFLVTACAGVAVRLNQEAIT